MAQGRLVEFLHYGNWSPLRRAHCSGSVAGAIAIATGFSVFVLWFEQSESTPQQFVLILSAAGLLSPGSTRTWDFASTTADRDEDQRVESALKKIDESSAEKQKMIVDLKQRPILHPAKNIIGRQQFTTSRLRFTVIQTLQEKNQP